MCGIAGIWNRSGEPVDKSLIERMTRVLKHRGPDGQKTQLLGDVALGHRRLSIIDLSSAADQPMSLPDGSLWLTYNGEIHNYVELRNELATRGASFATRSDTEVVLWAYKIWGAGCFERFNGMWALALWEPELRRLTLSRDRFGIKPLHYSIAGDRIAFGSEAKAILAAFPTEAKVDWRSAFEFLSGGWPQADPHTFYESIRSVPPAHNLVFSQSREMRRKYWRFEPGSVQRNQSPPEEFMALLDDSVRLRLRSDVPVGVCLSGGLDSSAIARAMKRQSQVPIECFSLQYDDERIDESRYAKMVADDPRHYQMNWVHPRTDDFVGTLEKIVWHYDAPSAIRGKYPKWFVMENARRKMTVLLGGHGADEILGGYGHFVLPYIMDCVLNQHSIGTLDHVRILVRSIRQLLNIEDGLMTAIRRSSRSLLKQRISPGGWPWQRLISDDFVQRYQPPPANRTRNAWFFAKGTRPFDSRFDSALWFELTTAGLPESLHAEDATSMAFGIESRLPFLDHRIVEYCFSLPFDQKFREGWTKWPLRNLTSGFLPEAIRWRRKKLGYPGAFVEWMTERRTVSRLRDIFVSGPAVDAGFLDRARIHATGSKLEKFTDFIRKDPERVWRIVTLQLWYQRFFTGKVLK